jgi:hypothetical protein
MIYSRYIAYVAVLLSIVFLPYWIYVPILFFNIIAFRLFWEGIVFGFLIDALYTGVTLSLSNFPYLFGFWALVFVVMMMPIHHRVRNYV